MSDYAPALTEILDREPEPPGGVDASDVDYDVDGTACTGFLAVPPGAGPHPGVLVVHDWLGVSDVVKMRCEMLARLGYAAFAADIYGSEVRPSPEDAPSVARGFYTDQDLWRQRVAGAFDRMREEDAVDTARTAAIGYCFGGATALQLARSGAPVDGVVSFHGALQTGDADRITASLLVLTGANDPVVPDSAVQAFEDELRQTPEVDWQVVTYAGAMHAFTIPGTDSPDHGAQFQATAERRSWQAMKDFLGEVFAG